MASPVVRRGSNHSQAVSPTQPAARIAKPNKGRAAPAKRTAADVIELCFHKNDEKNKLRHAELLRTIEAGSQRNVEATQALMDSVTCMREEASSTAAAFRQQLKDLFSDLTDAVKAANQNNIIADGQDMQAGIIEKVEVIQEVVKLCVSLEFLDESKGENIFMGPASPEDGSSFHEFLMKGAEICLGNEYSVEKAIEFLNTEVTIEKGKICRTQKIAVFASQGQGRAHDNIRNQALKAFQAGCASENALNPSSGTSDEKKKEVASHLFDTGEHKKLEEYDQAWFSACYAGVSEARSVARGCLHFIQSRRPHSALPELTAAENGQSNIAMSAYAFGFISMKITQALRKLGCKPGGKMNRSHCPLWVREVLFWNKNIQETENGLLVFERLNISRVLTETEENNLKNLAFESAW